jgi:hypothetical protein
MNAKHLKDDLAKGVTAIYELINEGNLSLLGIALHSKSVTHLPIKDNKIGIV